MYNKMLSIHVPCSPPLISSRYHLFETPPFMMSQRVRSKLSVPSSTVLFYVTCIVFTYLARLRGRRCIPFVVYGMVGISSSPCCTLRSYAYVHTLPPVFFPCSPPSIYLSKCCTVRVLVLCTRRHRPKMSLKPKRRHTILGTCNRKRNLKQIVNSCPHDIY